MRISQASCRRSDYPDAGQFDLEALLSGVLEKRALVNDHLSKCFVSTEVITANAVLNADADHEASHITCGQRTILPGNQ
jgi:hypothetical protein